MTCLILPAGEAARAGCRPGLLARARALRGGELCGDEDSRRSDDGPPRSRVLRRHSPPSEVVELREYPPYAGPPILRAPGRRVKRARTSGGGTKPIASYMRASVGAEASRAFSAPSSSRRPSSVASPRSSAYRPWIGSSNVDDRLRDVGLELAVARRLVPHLDRPGGSPVATVKRSIRFVTPGLSSPRRISLPESVTALLTFFRIVSGGSSMRSVPCAVPPVVDIFFAGSCRSMIRAPTSG